MHHVVVVVQQGNTVYGIKQFQHKFCEANDIFRSNWVPKGEGTKTFLACVIAHLTEGEHFL